MATLTTSWVTYASASYSSGSATIKFSLQAKYSSQSVANNTTAVQTRLRSDFTSGNSLAGAGYKFTCTYASTVSGSGTWYFANEVITNGSSTVSHNNDGTKSITLNASAYNKYWNFTKNMSATVSLPKINRIATVTSGTNFNDEGNPTITFSNPGGMNLQPYLNWYNSSGTRVHQILGTVGQYSSPYTWNLSSSQRNAIRSATNTQTSYNVREGLQTYNGNTLIENSANSSSNTFTIVNANPTLSYTIQETNTAVSDLLGSTSASTLIQNMSKVRVTVTPSAKKSATITKVVATNSGITKTDTSSPYQFDFDITNNSFNIVATDSRNLTGSTSFTKTLIQYQKVKQNGFSVKRVIPTGPDIRIQLESVYYQATFGNTANVPTVKYKIGSDSWVTLTAGTDYTIDNTNHKITLDKTLTNVVDYQSSTTVYVEVSDLLSSWSNNFKVSPGIPVFEFGENECRVNGAFKITKWTRNTTDTWIPVVGQGGILDYAPRKLYSSKTHTNYNNDQDAFATMSVLSWWNGAYGSSNASNLTYAHQGTIQCKPTQLYSNTSGTTSSITTLSDNVGNYTYLLIIYGWSGGDFGLTSTIVDVGLGKTINLSTNVYNNSRIYWATSKWTASNKNLTLNGAEWWSLGTSGSGSRNQANNVAVFKVYGIK